MKNLLLTFIIGIIFIGCGGDTNNDEENRISHNGFIYKSVISPNTQKVWLDRNLGATKACDTPMSTFDNSNESLNNNVLNYIDSQKECFGDYYQWGRESDGHEENSSTFTTEIALNIYPNHNEFILNSTNSDWTSDDVNGIQRSFEWSKIDGSSICPIGFRVPTYDEIYTEITFINGDDNNTNSDEAFNSFLKLPYGGVKGIFGNGVGFISIPTGPIGALWSSNVDANTTLSKSISYSYNGAILFSNRKLGANIRCIKD